MEEAGRPPSGVNTGSAKRCGCGVLCRTSALVTDTRLPRSTPHQQHAAFDVWGEGELIEEGAGADAVRSVQHGEIGG